MGHFLEPLTAFVGEPLLVEEIEGDSRWRLRRDVIYQTDANKRVIAPAGMTTDFASIPRFVWPLWPPYDRTYGKAAVIHDWLYQVHGRVEYDLLFSRREANLVFLEAMKSLGAGYFKRQTIYNAVQLFSRRW